MGVSVLERNPFADLSATLPPAAMQAFVACMIVLVLAGTLFDIVHKGSATYFFNNWRKAQSRAKRSIGCTEMAGLALKTGASEILTSSEFCNPRRRAAHLFTMYGFLAYVISTVVMVFWYPTQASQTPSLWPLLWHLGALMVCIGGYWFWFFIRVDVAAEGNSPLRIVRADMFILLLLASATLGLIWSYMQSTGSAYTNVLLGLYLLATFALFATIPWSKFSHMFFKPAAAFQKRIAKEDGSLDMLPAAADRSNPADRDRHSMELLKNAPMSMGLGIKREAPRHY